MNWLTLFLEFSAGVMGDTSSPAEPARKKPRIEKQSPSKLEKAQADYDQALGAYDRAEELLKKAEERLGKAFEDGMEGERLQFLKDALANAKDAAGNAKLREEFARRMLEVEMKNASQSEASEVAKKCLLFQLLTGCVVFLCETCSHFWIERHWVVHVLASSVH